MGKGCTCRSTLGGTIVSNFPQIQAEPNGGVDVIDIASLQKIKTIPIPGGIHDLYITPDGKYVVAGATEIKFRPANAGSLRRRTWEA